MTDERRFGGVARLFGSEGLARLGGAHVVVVGIGGVGSWTVEALARSGVGALTLIDLDHISESNLNRQIHALESTVGAAKVEVMRERIAQISPECRVTVVDDFITPDNVAALLPAAADTVIDAIDQVAAKAALIAHCRSHELSVLTCGGAGGRTDALQLREDDLAFTEGDALLAAVRTRLRRDYGFAPGATGAARRRAAPFGVPAVYSGESAPTMDAGGGAPLNCAGYGSLVTVTASLGFAVAGLAMRKLLGK